MQRFDENTLQGLYIQNLLYNYYLPNIRVLEVYRDDPEAVTAAIKSAIEEKGAELVCCTGGMKFPDVTGCK